MFIGHSIAMVSKVAKMQPVLSLLESIYLPRSSKKIGTWSFSIRWGNMKRNVNDTFSKCGTNNIVLPWFKLPTCVLFYFDATNLEKDAQGLNKCDIFFRFCARTLKSNESFFCSKFHDSTGPVIWFCGRKVVIRSTTRIIIWYIDIEHFYSHSDDFFSHDKVR